MNSVIRTGKNPTQVRHGADPKKYGAARNA
jgi:hypothetical protein